MINTIMKRRSYRGRYKPDPVPRADLVTIMEAVMPKKKAFEERAWFNSFPADRD